MELKFTVDTEDFYEMDFESVFTGAIKKEVIKICSADLASDKFEQFTQLISDTIVSGIKLKMENFLSEEIALTGEWGKPTFVGSIEDLMKKRFDEVLLRPVDSAGKTLRGCATSSSKTWIEWKITEDLNKDLTRYMEKAESDIRQAMTATINEKIIEIKDKALKQQVDLAFASMLKA